MFGGLWENIFCIFDIKISKVLHKQIKINFKSKIKGFSLKKLNMNFSSLAWVFDVWWSYFKRLFRFLQVRGFDKNICRIFIISTFWNFPHELKLLLNILKFWRVLKLRFYIDLPFHRHSEFSCILCTWFSPGMQKLTQGLIYQWNKTPFWFHFTVIKCFDCKSVIFCIFPDCYVHHRGPGRFDILCMWWS